MALRPSRLAILKAKALVPGLVFLLLMPPLSRGFDAEMTEFESSGDGDAQTRLKNGDVLSRLSKRLAASKKAEHQSRLVSQMARHASISGNGTRKGLYIAIPSRRCSLQGSKRRNIIRTTWGRPPSSYAKSFQKNHSSWITPAGSSWQWTIKFFVGSSDDNAQDHNATWVECQQELDSERTMYGDIVELQTVRESYMTLKNKTASMIAFGLEDSDLDSWDYIVKVDDDCTLRIDKLVETLDTKPPSRVYMGALENPAGFYAIRNKKSKWYLPYSVWPKGSPHFQYIGGWCYVLSRDVAQYCADRMLFRNYSSELPPDLWKSLPWEDAAIGLVASEIGVKPHHSSKFKSAWQKCSPNFIAKHHDGGNETGKSDLIVLTHQQILANPKGEIHCNPDTFAEGSYKSWRDLRNKGRS